MSSLNRRLEQLEEELLKKTAPPPIPPEVAVLSKAIARHQALKDSLPLPPYTQEELEHLYTRDLKEAAGEGMAAELRNNSGWQNPEAQALLDEWEEGARERVEWARALPPERWYEVYEAHEE